MGWKKSKENAEFEAPDLTHYKPLVVQDIEILKKLSKRFTTAGVLNREEANFAENNIGENTFREATNNAKYEKELNTAHYHADLEDLVKRKELEQSEDFDNPSLDGVDDYGRQMYENRMQSAAIPPSIKNVVIPTFKEAKKEHNSTIQALKKDFEERGINPFSEGVYSKHTPVNTIANVKTVENDSENEKSLNETDAETINLYAKILAKAKTPNTGE